MAALSSKDQVCLLYQECEDQLAATSAAVQPQGEAASYISGPPWTSDVYETTIAAEHAGDRKKGQKEKHACKNESFQLKHISFFCGGYFSRQTMIVNVTG